MTEPSPDLFYLAKSGDRDAMDRVLVSFSRWVRSKAERPPPGVDFLDAESIAWDSLWLAIRKCDTPYPIYSFARRAFAYRVKSLRRARSARPRVVAVDLDGLSASAIRYPAARGPAELPRPPWAGEVGPVPPCARCGEVAGYRLKHGKRPVRIRGLCNTCATRERRKNSMGPATGPTSGEEHQP